MNPEETELTVTPEVRAEAQDVMKQLRAAQERAAALAVGQLVKNRIRAVQEHAEEAAAYVRGEALAAARTRAEAAQLTAQQALVTMETAQRTYAEAVDALREALKAQRAAEKEATS